MVEGRRARSLARRLAMQALYQIQLNPRPWQDTHRQFDDDPEAERVDISQEEIERMVAEAEEFAEEDKATRARIEARNGLENYAFSLKNQVNDDEGLGGKIDEDDKETILEAVKEATDLLNDLGGKALGLEGIE